MILTYPLITISSRLQVQKNMHSEDAYKVKMQDTGSVVIAIYVPRISNFVALVQNSLDPLMKILRTEGIFGLYSYGLIRSFAFFFFCLQLKSFHSPAKAA